MCIRVSSSGTLIHIYLRLIICVNPHQKFPFLNSFSFSQHRITLPFLYIFHRKITVPPTFLHILGIHLFLELPCCGRDAFLRGCVSVGAFPGALAWHAGSGWGGGSFSGSRYAGHCDEPGAKIVSGKPSTIFSLISMA